MTMTYVHQMTMTYVNQMTIIHTIPTFSIPRPSEINPHWEFGFENTPSGNLDLLDTMLPSCSVPRLKADLLEQQKLLCPAKNRSENSCVRFSE
jgi:hypothetical protein